MIRRPRHDHRPRPPVPALLAGALVVAALAPLGAEVAPRAAPSASYEELAAAEAVLAGALREARDRAPEGFASRAEARFRQAELAWTRGDFGRAAGAFLSVLEDEPPSPWSRRARLGLGNALLALGDWEAAAGELQALLDEPAADGEDDEGIRSAARRRLDLIYRTRLRPAAGQPPWTGSRRLPLGDEIKKPAAVAARDDGALAVVDAGPDLLLELGADGAGRRSRPFPGPHRPEWSRDGEPVVAGPALVDDRGRRLRDVRAALAGPLGESLVVTGKPEDRVLLFTAAGRFDGTVAGPPSLEPADLARDPHGRIYFLDRRRPAVFRYDPESGASEEVLQGSWGSPEALAVDAAGNFYILDGKSGRLEVYDSRGRSLAGFGPALPGGGALERPVDLAVDGAGRLCLLASRPSTLVVLE